MKLYIKLEFFLFLYFDYLGVLGVYLVFLVICKTYTLFVIIVIYYHIWVFWLLSFIDEFYVCVYLGMSFFGLELVLTTLWVCVCVKDNRSLDFKVPRKARGFVFFLGQKVDFYYMLIFFLKKFLFQNLDVYFV